MREGVLGRLSRQERHPRTGADCLRSGAHRVQLALPWIALGSDCARSGLTAHALALTACVKPALAATASTRSGAGCVRLPRTGADCIRGDVSGVTGFGEVFGLGVLGVRFEAS